MLLRAMAGVPYHMGGMPPFLRRTPDYVKGVVSQREGLEGDLHAAMSVSDPKVIDLIGVERITGNVVLTLTDHLDWSDTHHHLVLLQEKVNTYLRFIESGELLSAYPDAKGRSVVIGIVAKYLPSADGERFLKGVESTIAKAGIGFRFEHLMT
jgi:hypothetical protein